MTRDDLRGIIDGITDEQLKRILDINSSDIGRVKVQGEELKVKLEEAEGRLAEYEDIARRLEVSQCEAEEMRTRINELQKVIDQSEAEAKAEKSREELERRFECAADDATFLNDFTRNGIFAEFLEAVADEKNARRSDKEIFGRLVENRENLFVPEGGIPSVIASTMGFGGQITDGDVREIMGLEPMA